MCNNCQQVGHIWTICALPLRCRWCRGTHKTYEHACSVLNCPGGFGERCEHTIRVCFLRDSSGHFTGYQKCPALRATPESTGPATLHSPITADETSVSGVNDDSRNRGRRCARSWPGTSLAQAQVDESQKLADAKIIPSTISVINIRRHDHVEKLTLAPISAEDKGKGRADDIPTLPVPVPRFGREYFDNPAGPTSKGDRGQSAPVPPNSSS